MATQAQIDLITNNITSNGKGAITASVLRTVLLGILGVTAGGSPIGGGSALASDYIARPQDYGTIGGPDDTAAINAALATGGAWLTQNANITGLVTVPGFTAARNLPNSTLVFGPGTHILLNSTGSFVNQGFMVGIGAQGADFSGLWKLQDSRFTEVYASALAGHSTGEFNGIAGSAHQNGQNGYGQPCGTIGYGLMSHPGNIVFGVFGRADQFAPGVVTNELNTFNFFGDPPSLANGFPARGFGNTFANPITLTLACGGTYRSTAAIQITREGSPSNTAQANYRCGMYVDYCTDFGIVINGNGAIQNNDGNGSPKTGMLIYTCPNSDNGIAILAAGKVSDYGAGNPFLLAISSNRNTDAGAADPANTYTVLSARVDGSINWRHGYIDGPTGNLGTAGSISANKDGAAAGILQDGRPFVSRVASSAGGASGQFLEYVVNGASYKIALLNP